jgi:hypothetical protein
MLYELCATALELVTLGELRLVPAVCSGAAGDRARPSGAPCGAGARSAPLVGRAVLLRPELDEALDRTGGQSRSREHA